MTLELCFLIVFLFFLIQRFILKFLNLYLDCYRLTNQSFLKTKLKTFPPNAFGSYYGLTIVTMMQNYAWGVIVKCIGLDCPPQTKLTSIKLGVASEKSEADIWKTEKQKRPAWVERNKSEYLKSFSKMPVSDDTLLISLQLPKHSALFL